MQKYIFRNKLPARRKTGCSRQMQCGSLEELIRKMLEIHELMNITDICRKTGFQESDLRPALEAMIARGEAERLRPRDYESDDLDFFRLRGPQRQPDISAGHNRWFSRFQRAARLIFDSPEDNFNRHHVNNILTTS